jgi:predicted nucleic acid-binding protein
LNKIALFDTNVYINHYLGYEPIKKLFGQVITEGHTVKMSSIVAMELLWNGKAHSDSTFKATRLAYVNRPEILPVDKIIALKARNPESVANGTR